MAYQTNISPAKYLSASAPVTAVPLTMSCRFFSTLTLNDRTLVAINENDSNGSVFVLSMRSNNQIGAGVYRAGTGYFQSLTSAATINVWNHAAGVFSSNSNRIAYLNGVAGSANTNLVTPINCNFMGIGAVIRPSVFEPFQGYLADVGVWNVALTAEEIASLADGMTCDKIRPQSLVFYAPLVRDLIDVKGGLTITNNNSATVANHPRVYS
jgi:hypothetical protein